MNLCQVYMRSSDIPNIWVCTILDTVKIIGHYIRLVGSVFLQIGGYVKVAEIPVAR